MGSSQIVSDIFLSPYREVKFHLRSPDSDSPDLDSPSPSPLKRTKKQLAQNWPREVFLLQCDHPGCTTKIDCSRSDQISDACCCGACSALICTDHSREHVHLTGCTGFLQDKDIDALEIEKVPINGHGSKERTIIKASDIRKSNLAILQLRSATSLSANTALDVIPAADANDGMFVVTICLLPITDGYLSCLLFYLQKAKFLLLLRLRLRSLLRLVQTKLLPPTSDDANISFCKISVRITSFINLINPITRIQLDFLRQ